jgi:hypothetical protein
MDNTSKTTDENPIEGVKLRSETYKHLTPLDAGSIVLITTFVQNIFQKA